MTQTGGLVVLAAWVMFGVLVTLLAWTVLRHHDDPVRLACDPDGHQPTDDAESAGSGAGSGAGRPDDQP
ncbi:hypothetical protein G9U51_02485 [Calidifontibacter sp. DB0510]|uniref:Uncharacterized protein n=1 Tax=Metallococcus carri TaxID=1656884 RepID=A0A967EG55_9MICO|nr:hypothetical protein [Metallococcus carri]NHN54648.1 hypothetical protein [Metallococcus carri]NOP36993.1 hypothetical protein [Calidifontibacter sp. DB2511S]